METVAKSKVADTSTAWSELREGKFDTNYLACALAAVAMNWLRLLGQHTLYEPNSPVRHTAQR